MVQMDGSHHAWFGPGAGRCCLMVMVDDATGRMQGRFYDGESLAAAMDVFGRWCRRSGVPRGLYVDRAGIYRCDREPTAEELVGRATPTTQFGRACGELGVRLTLARSPQAKGRVERANGTLQDRLVKELRVARVSGVDAANAWLDRSRFFELLSDRFGVEPADAADAHRPLVTDLSRVLCVKEKRAVSNDGCVQWDGRGLPAGGVPGRAAGGRGVGAGGRVGPGGRRRAASCRTGRGSRRRRPSRCSRTASRSSRARPSGSRSAGPSRNSRRRRRPGRRRGDAFTASQQVTLSRRYNSRGGRRRPPGRPVRCTPCPRPPTPPADPASPGGRG